MTKSFVTCLALLFAFFRFAYGGAKKCSTEATCACGTQTSDIFNRGDDTYGLCLRFSGYNESSKNVTYTSSNERNLYYLTTTVDEFTLVSLAGSNLGSSNWTSPSSVQLEIGGYTSESRFIKKGGFAITQLTAVIVVSNGNVKDIVWDDSCIACSKNACQDKNCGTGLSFCQRLQCDFKIYLSWYGTDRKGSYMLSAGERLSRYQSYSAKSYYKDTSSQLSNVDQQYNGYRQTGQN